nr:hypothetical protein [Jeotgalibacillus malaysiensis]
MARKSKAKKESVVVVKKNPAIFTEDELISYRKTLIQELTWQSKGQISEKDIEELAESVLNKDEKTTLKLRNKGVLQMTRVLIQKHLEKEKQAC